MKRILLVAFILAMGSKETSPLFANCKTLLADLSSHQLSSLKHRVTRGAYSALADGGSGKKFQGIHLMKFTKKEAVQFIDEISTHFLTAWAFDPGDGKNDGAERVYAIVIRSRASVHFWMLQHSRHLLFGLMTESLISLSDLERLEQGGWKDRPLRLNIQFSSIPGIHPIARFRHQDMIDTQDKLAGRMSQLADPTGFQTGFVTHHHYRTRPLALPVRVGDVILRVNKGQLLASDEAQKVIQEIAPLCLVTIEQERK